MGSLEARWQPTSRLDVAEKLMLDYVAKGEQFNGHEHQPSPGPEEHDAESQRASIRPAVLRHLLTAAEWSVDPKGVRLRGVRIRGLLDLEAVPVRCPLVLDDCDLDGSGPMALTATTIPLLVMTRCRLSGISADSINVAGNLNLRGSVISGPVVLTGARIGGSLLCMGARLGVNNDRNSLICHGMNVRLSVHLRHGFASDGAIAMPRANIDGDLLCDNSRFGANAYGTSLFARGVRIGGTVSFDGGFRAAGAVQLDQAIIGGRLSGKGASIGHLPPLVMFDWLELRSLVSLNCQAARLSGKGTAGALAGDEMKVGGSIYLTDQLIAEGVISLTQATVGGSLRCSSAKLGADSDQEALVADQANIAGGLSMDQGFVVNGIVSLRGASIRRELRWEPAAPTSGEVNLEGASAQYLIDDWTGARIGGFWPHGRLRLVGFTYAAFGGNHQATVEQRLDWIRSQYEERPDSSHSDNGLRTVFKISTGGSENSAP